MEIPKGRFTAWKGLIIMEFGVYSMVARPLVGHICESREEVFD
jgi:hypothetical protein